MQIPQDSADQLFFKARSYKMFADRPVSEDTLRSVYEMARLAPTSSNTSPMRVVFATSPEAKALVVEAANDGNKDKVRSAPVTAIIAHDTEFWTHLPTLSPHMKRPYAFETMSEDGLTKFLLRNGSLQAGFFILAARAHGLDCGPMSGFSAKKINESFFGNSTWRANFLVNLGYGTEEKLHERAARLDFDTACEIR